MRSICLTIVLVLSGFVFATPPINPLVYAPEISTITVDGNMADWTDSSEWLDFGAWFERGVADISHPNGVPSGLSSTTQARYAWNGDDPNNSLLYIGIESTEGTGLILEVGGLMADLYDDPNVAVATPQSSKEATQIEFKNWSGGIPNSIDNQFEGTTTNVAAAYSIDGNTVTIEIALPIYRDWSDDSTAIALNPQMDVYVYANLIEAAWDLADSQVADGAYVSLFDGNVIELATLVRLLETSSPQVCDDIPDKFKNESDLNLDCYVNFKDFALTAGRWLQCNNPTDPNCGSM